MSFKFGDITHKSLGTMQKSIPTPNGNNMTFRCDIISADNPVLLALDIMGTEGLMVNVRDLELKHIGCSKKNSEKYKAVTTWV